MIGAGLQRFMHEKHTNYACLGPYIKDWMLGAASWHPSVIAHRLRASHHAYFWLVMLKEAVANLAKKLDKDGRDPATIQKDIQVKIDEYYGPLESRAFGAPPFPDDAQCLTDYEPSFNKEGSLVKKVVMGLTDDLNKPGTCVCVCVYE